ncbi:MAG TPA: hypothetical protein VN600_06210 [Gemmatimonadaceae bacterium]|nr:hypothetical protein [Gemmatimonadaceae bacterium]
MSRRSIFSTLTAALVVACAAVAPAAAQARFAIAPAQRDTVAIGSSGTATMVFDVKNLTADSAVARPELVLPDGWTPLFGSASVALAPHGSDTWLAGVTAPATAAAGSYVVRAMIHDSARVIADSMIVRVDARRAVEVLTSDAPGFIAAGAQYQATFYVRNRGNVPARLTLSISSGAGSSCSIQAKTIDLAAGGRAAVVASVTAPDVARSTDDVIELVASSSGENVSASSSARVLIVPRHSSGSAIAPSLPAELSLRAAGPNAGVAPIALRGSGPIVPGSATNVDFSFRAPVGQQSIFGERDEYRADIFNGTYRLGLGDESRSFSPLTASGFPGLGATMSTDNLPVNAGVYAERDRWSPVGEFESGAFVGTDTGALVSALAAVVGRNTGARVGGLTARAHLFSSVLEVETAGSDSSNANGAAGRMELSGNYRPINYDLGVLRATPSFAGPGRGNTDLHASVAARPAGPVWFQLNSTSQHTVSQPGALFDFNQSITTNFLQANWRDLFSVGYEILTNHLGANNDLLATDQRGPRLGAHARFGFIDLRGTAAYQQLVFGNGTTQPYEMYRVEALADLGMGRAVSLFGEESTGSEFDGLGGGGALAGASSQLALPLGFALNWYGSVSVPRYAGAGRNVQGDVSLSHELRNGTTMLFREHFARYDRGLSVPGMNALYLELRTPLHIPTAPSRSSGRVTGRVFDEASGRGLSNLLVRIGDESVITDGQGRVSVSGLKPGHYGVSLESADHATRGVLVGDVTVDVRADDDRPATFSVALAQSAHVRASIRQLEAANGSLDAGNDSLVDKGGLENAMVALEGARDTIYQTTDANGRVDFGHVAPGAWTVHVLSAEIPDFHTLEMDRFTIVVAPGETRDVQFRVVPKRRTIRMLDQSGAPVVIHSSGHKASPHGSTK